MQCSRVALPLCTVRPVFERVVICLLMSLVSFALSLCRFATLPLCRFAIPTCFPRFISAATVVTLHPPLQRCGWSVAPSLANVVFNRFLVLVLFRLSSAKTSFSSCTEGSLALGSDCTTSPQQLMSSSGAGIPDCLRGFSTVAGISTLAQCTRCGITIMKSHNSNYWYLSWQILGSESR